MDAREQWRRELGWRDRGRAEGGGISNMPGQMHGPTVVCHSYRFRSFRYSFPLNASSSPRFPPRNRRLLLLPRALPSLSSRLRCPRCFLLLIVRFSRLRESTHPPRAPFRPAVLLFSSLCRVITVSAVACAAIPLARGILFTMFARGSFVTWTSPREKNMRFVYYTIFYQFATSIS